MRLAAARRHGSRRFTFSASGRAVGVLCSGCRLSASGEAGRAGFELAGTPDSPARTADHLCRELVLEWAPDCPGVERLRLAREVMER